MADKSLKLAYNAPGEYYVTDECIDCDMCRNLAPDIFQRKDSDAYSFVFRQPASQAERNGAEEALASCPVEAIGDDGL